MADHACDFCARVVRDITYPTVQERQVPDMPRRQKWLEHIELGLLSDLMAREHCSFCSFVSALFQSLSLHSHPDRALPAYDQISCQIRAGSTLPNESGIRRNWDLLLRFDEVVEDGSFEIPIDSVSFTVDAADITALNPEQAINMGRLVRSDGCDSDWMKRSYETCTQMHGSDCDTSTLHYGEDELTITTDRLPSNFRLIDVDDMCVVDAPPNPTYVALSYVWGTSNSLLLQTFNEAQLRVCGAFRQLNSPVPRTLADAMEVTRLIGERYLWIDSLCIIQDKPSDKLQQINKMGSVYARSSLTIVAADSPHADYGLTGLRQSSRHYQQTTARSNGITFLFTALSAHELISKSAWWTRAWTFQEFRLSKRLLTFTDSVVLFHCQASDFTEDRVRYLGAGTTESEYIHEWQDLTSSLNLRGFDAQDYYSAIAGPYSQRNMSFPSDVIPAIVGVLETVSTTLGLQYDAAFTSGTPNANLFDYGLLWVPIGRITRRPACTAPAPLPSWCWAGWIGPVGIWVEQTGLGNQLRYKYDENSEAATQEITDLQCLHLPEVITSGVTSDMLSFRANVTSLVVERSSWGQLVPFQDQESRYTALYKVMMNNAWVGSILLDHDNNSYRLNNPEKCFKFIILSRAIEDAIWRSGDLEEGIDLSIFDISAPSLSGFELPAGEDFYLLNALFVEYTDSISKRVGVAQLHP